MICLEVAHRVHPCWRSLPLISEQNYSLHMHPKRAVRQQPHPGCGDQERTTAHARSPGRSLCPVGQADQSEEDQSILAAEKQKDNKPAIHHTAGPSTEGSRVFAMESLI